MNPIATSVVLLLGGVAGAQPAPARSPSVVTQSVVTRSHGGAELFRTYCASCHGASGRGDGAISASLRVAPADLTTLARRNRGKFDADKVRRRIDGRDVVRPHGDSDMPVWGDAFKHAGEGYSEAKVKERIDAIVDYLKTLQQP
jgi:mono/diheme cytochrome c family protein